jgi:hypothetical protein
MELLLVGGALALLLVLVAVVLHRAKHKDVHISYLSTQDSRMEDWSWCRCHGCGHAFIVAPCGEQNLYWDIERELLRPMCPQCRLQADGVYDYFKDCACGGQEGCSECAGDGRTWVGPKSQAPVRHT